MIETSALYKTLFNQGAIQEYRIEVEGVMYDDDVIYDRTEISEKLFDTDTFTIGSFTVSLLNVKLWLANNEIPRNAEIKFYYRYVNDTERSEWILKFVGNVFDRTRYTDEITTITAYSKAANYDVFLDYFSESVPSYPANAQTVANLCATHLGLIIDNIEKVYNGDIVEYPNELTVIQVMQNIAKASGGNWAIVEDGVLRLVVLENEIPTLEYPAQSITQSELLSPISKVMVYWKDDSAFEAGDDSGSVIEISNPWATQANTNYLLSVLDGYEYIPVSGTKVYADPALQLGDVINYPNGVEQTVAQVTWTFDGVATADISTPQGNEIAYDNPFDTLVQQEFKKKVTLGESYQGVTIGRENGIQMLLSPDGTDENAIGRYYADLNKGLAFQTRNSPSDPWTDWMYFDIPEKTFKLSLYSTTTEINEKFEDVEDQIKNTTEWTIGSDGYWYADGVKTDKKAIGEDGTVADIWTIGANGNWYKNGVDTGNPSQGPKGDKGEQGIPGQKGADGTIYYTWLKYADTPTTGMSDLPTGKKYMGIAVNKTTQTESTNYADYTWSKVEGDQGVPGTPGANGQTTYTWVKYADTPTTGMSDSPTDKKYIGLAFNKTTQTESTVYGDYQWSLMPQNITTESRNYILDSLKPFDQYIEMYLSEPTEIGVTYTFSVETVHTGALEFDFYKAGSPDVQSVTLPSGTRSITVEFTDNWDRFYQITEATITKSWLTKSNHQMGWTPAPEDLESQVSELGNEVIRVETEMSANFDLTTQEILLERSTRETQYGTLYDGITQNTEKISLAEGQIQSEVTARETQGDQIMSELNSQITQTSENFQVMFTQLQAGQALTDDQLQEFQTYFRFDINGAIVGKSGAPIEFFQQNDMIGFRENGEVIAFWQEATMNVDNLIALVSIVIGTHQIKKYNNSNLSDVTSIVQYVDRG